MEIPQQQQAVSQSIVQTQPITTVQQTCPFCHVVTFPNNYFCPNCGKKLREKPFSTSVLSQIGIYLLSVLLPPLGLWPAFRYLRQKDEKAKIVGLVALVLTVLSTVVTLWLAIQIMVSVNKNINEQLNMYQF